MEALVQSVLTDGGAGTLIVEKKEGKETDASDVPSSSHLLPIPTSANQQEVVSPTAIEDDEEETRFQKDLEEAIAASTRESLNARPTPGAEGEDERFERDTKMMIELSLKEEEEVEQGLMQAAKQSEREVDALAPPKS